MGWRDVCGDGRGNVKGDLVTGETDKIAAEPAWIGYSPDDLAASTRSGRIHRFLSKDGERIQA